MIDRKWREPAWRAAFCWPDLSALDSIDYIAWPGGDLLLQTVCIIPTCQRAKWGIHSKRRKTYFLSGFLVFKSLCNMSFLAAGTQGRTTKCQKSELFCETTWLLENLISYGKIVEKVNNTKSNILSVAILRHIPLIWFNLYIFQFRNRFRQNHKSYPRHLAKCWFLW